MRSIGSSLAIGLWLLLAGPALAEATLLSVSGAVEIGRGEPPVWHAAKAGDALAAGDRIRTSAGARAELKLGEQRSARIYERSMLQIGDGVTASGAARSVRLEAGASLFDLVRKAVREEFDVHTPEIIVSVKGTRFLVEATEGVDWASVFRGEVKLSGEEFDAVSLYPGFTGVLGEVHPTPFVDPWETWSASAEAPQFALEKAGELELREAVKAARDPEPAGPAKRDSEADSTRPKDEPRGKLERDDGVDMLERGSEGNDKKGSSSDVELDGVADVASSNARGGNGDSLLDAVLGGSSEDFPGGGSESGNGGEGSYAGGPGGSTNPFPFTFDVQTSGGPNTVTVGFGATSVTLDQNDIDTLLSGSSSPLGTFNAVVSSLGIDRQDLAAYLDTLL